MIPRHKLISDDYLAEQRTLHMLPQGYGGKGSKWAEAVIWLCREFGCWSVLDYGCGQGSLKRTLDERGVAFDVREYDPAIDGKDGPPKFADLVVCTDVLEHVEMERLGNVVRHIQGLARKIVLLSVALDPANKFLTDGRNAHLIQRPPAWWEAVVTEHHMPILDVPQMPTPYAAKPEKRAKRWIAVLKPYGEVVDERCLV
jgi:hypothetical protein